MQHSGSGGKFLEQAQSKLDQAEKHLKDALSLANDAKLKDKLNQAVAAIQEAQM